MGAPLDQHLPLAGLNPLRHDLRVIPIADGADGEDHRLAPRQELRPAMAEFSLLRVQAGDGLRRAPGGRNPQEARTSDGCEDNGVIGPPARPTGAQARITGAPPLVETFLSLLAAKNPTHRPSGEKKGFRAPSVPGIGLPSGSSIARR